MINLNDEKRLNIHVVISSSVLILVLLAWISLMVLNPLSGTHMDQLRNLVEHWQLFRLNFAIALTIAPVFMYFIVSLHRLLIPTVSMTKIAGYTIAVFYVAAATLSYGAQLTLVPYYLNQNAIFMAELWYFFNPDSIAYFINQTGYAFWAVSVMVLFSSLVKRLGIEKWLGVLFILSSIASLVAYAVLLSGVPAFAFLTLISGGLTLPTAMLALVLAIKRLKGAENTQNLDQKKYQDHEPLQEEEGTATSPVGEDTGEDVDLKEPMNTEASSNKKGNTKKRIFMVFLVTSMVFAGILAGFIGVVSIMNPVSEEMKLLEVYNPQGRQLPLKTPVTITTFNIGYGGLDKDRDFFMDGGVESRSESLERTLENSKEMINFLQALKPNIMLLQEVDIRSSRSFDVDQLTMFREAFSDHASVHGWNYKAIWVPVPVFNPMGYTDSGITTFSEYAIQRPVRYHLPGSEAWPRQLFDLDRCMVETRIPVENGKTLVLVNLHLSAYDKGGMVRKHQIGFVKQYLTDQASEGHYVIVGGDWNHLLAPYQMDDPVFMANWPDWLMPMPEDFSPEGYSWAVDPNVYTVRDNKTPYEPGKSFVTVIDGFIVSDNVEIHGVEGHDLGFIHSDHNPVSLLFSLK